MFNEPITAPGSANPNPKVPKATSEGGKTKAKTKPTAESGGGGKKRKKAIAV
jgi:hypothetical protein